jgi:ssDNA-specific exonuclease RecJ
MTNDICLKGFWPPEAKVVVNKGCKNQLPFTHFFGIIDSQKINGFTGIMSREHFKNSYKINLHLSGGSKW